jgi:hypothetical protein
MFPYLNIYHLDLSMHDIGFTDIINNNNKNFLSKLISPDNLTYFHVQAK